MQTSRRGAGLASALTAALALSVAGCHSGGSGTSTTNGVPTLNAADTVASVKKQTISQAQFFTQLQNYAANPQNPAAASLPAGRAVLQQMITNTAFIEMAKDQNAAPTDAEVDAQFSNLKMLEDARNVKPLEERLADSGLSPQDVKDMQIRPQLAQIKLLTKGSPAPTDAQVRSYYDQHKADNFTKPERAHVRAIVLANQTDAQQISQQIKGGQSFDTFLPRSLNKQLVNGELPQWVPLDMTKMPEAQKVQMTPLIKAVKSVKPGQTTPPLAFQGGWWLIQVVESKPLEVVPFDSVKGLIPYLLMEQSVQQNMAQLQQMQTQVRDYELKLATSGDIKVSLPGSQYTQMMADLKTPPPPAPSMMPTPMPSAPPSGARPAGPSARH